MDTLVKERLTGAVILVGLIVVLVPELLSGPIHRAVNRAAVSPAEEPPLRSYTINLADEAHGGSGAARPQPSDPATPAEAPPVAPAPAASGPSQTASAPPAAAPSQPAPQAANPPVAAPAHAAVVASAAAPVGPPAAAKASAAPAAAGSAVAYVVQLGSFANRANAERLAQQVHALGYPVGVSRGTTGRRLYRVQAGPARDRAAAEQMAAKLHSQGHDGKVVPK